MLACPKELDYPTETVASDLNRETPELTSYWYSSGCGTAVSWVVNVTGTAKSCTLLI